MAKFFRFAPPPIHWLSPRVSPLFQWWGSDSLLPHQIRVESIRSGTDLTGARGQLHQTPILAVLGKPAPSKFWDWGGGARFWGRNTKSSGAKGTILESFG